MGTAERGLLRGASQPTLAGDSLGVKDPRACVERDSGFPRARVEHSELLRQSDMPLAKDTVGPFDSESLVAIGKLWLTLRAI